MRALVLLALAACFHPDPPAGRACGPNNWCPDPLECVASVCRERQALVDDAGVDSAAKPMNLAFVSAPITLPGKDLSMLDAHCSSGAPAGTYVAWYSSDNFSAASRLNGKHGWVRPDGNPFANRVEDLLAGRIYYPLRVDLSGSSVAGTTAYVATATKPDGTYSMNACLGGGTGPLDFGVPDGTTGAWTSEAALPTCTTTVRVYCLQIDHSNDVAAPVAAGRRGFLSTTTVVGTAGIAQMNALCTMEAGAAARAIVALTGQTAKSRLPTGMPIVRADGVIAFDASGNQLAPLNVGVDGNTYYDVNVWAGASRLDEVATDNCSGWSAGGGSGRVGRSSRSLNESFGGVSALGCQNSLPVYCVVE
jgi:hypothetical protein